MFDFYVVYRPKATGRDGQWRGISGEGASLI